MFFHYNNSIKAYLTELNTIQIASVYTGGISVLRREHSLGSLGTDLDFNLSLAVYSPCDFS